MSFTVIPPAPTIASFNPNSGYVGDAIAITGTNLTGATSVKFNGVSASFTVNSAMSITATIPTGCSSGLVEVTTAGGTVRSSNGFTVNTAGNGTLTLAVQDEGVFIAAASVLNFMGVGVTTTESEGVVTINIPGGGSSGGGGSGAIVTTSGLVAEYRFNEMSGQQLTDTSSNALHGTLGSTITADSQDPTWIDWADVGLSFFIDDFVKLPSHNAWFTNNAFTLEVCAMLRSYQNWSRLLDFGIGATSINNVYLAASQQTTGKPAFGILEGNSNTYIQSPNALPLNTFFYLQAIFHSGIGSIYQNLALVARGALPTPTIVNRTQNYIGRSQYSTDAYLDGIVVLTRVYNRELSKSERINNYKASKEALNVKGISL